MTAFDFAAGSFLDRLTPAEAYLFGAQVAYSTGYERGWREATARADIDIVSALTVALGGSDCTDRKDAVRRHQQHLDHLKARKQWQARIGPRPDDYQGGPVDWETGAAQ